MLVALALLKDWAAPMPHRATRAAGMKYLLMILAHPISDDQLVATGRRIQPVLGRYDAVGAVRSLDQETLIAAIDIGDQVGAGDSIEVHRPADVDRRAGVRCERLDQKRHARD